MPEVLSVRLPDPAKPKRDKDFETALGKGGASLTKVTRELVDAYVKFVNKYNRLPAFPLEIVESRESAPITESEAPAPEIKKGQKRKR